MMRAAVRWILVSMLVGLAACKGDPGEQGIQGVAGPQGPTGPVGAQGPQGPPGPGTSYPTSPELVSGITQHGCIGLAWNGTGFPAFGGMAIFPRKFSSATSTPVVVAMLDSDSGGANSLRLLRPSSNRVTFRCNNTADSIHWLAVERGVHTISGHRLEAGVVPNTGTGTSGTVSFTPPGFSAPPIILLSIDETAAAGTLSARVTGTPTSTQFSFSLNAATNGLALHWIAMDPSGSTPYQHGRYRWTADVLQVSSGPSACTTVCSLPRPAGLTTDPSVLLTINDTNSSGGDRIWLNGVNPSTGAFTFQMNAATENVYWVVLEDLP